MWMWQTRTFIERGMIPSHSTVTQRVTENIKSEPNILINQSKCRVSQVGLSLKVGFQCYLTTRVAGFSCNFFQKRVLKYILSLPSLSNYYILFHSPWIFDGLQYHVLYSVFFQESKYTEVLQEGRPHPGPETGLLTNTRKWIVWGDTCADKTRDFIGKGHPGGEQ